jgi:hypothetical protein
MPRPIYRAGRLVGVKDDNGFYHYAKTLADAPMASKDSSGSIHLAGGTTEAVNVLAEAAQIAKKRVTQRKGKGSTKDQSQEQGQANEANNTVL